MFKSNDARNRELPLQLRILHALFSSVQTLKEKADKIESERSFTSRGKYSDIHDQEPWPQKISLYQPYEVEQILLPDNANCLAVQAFLKMCGLNFQVEMRHNAEYMSPSGKVPFIKCGAFYISEFENIVTFVENKATSLSSSLDSSDKADMRAYISLVNNVLLNAELYMCWVHEPTLNEITKVRHGYAYPWPLNYLLNAIKQRQVIKKLKVLGWYHKTLEEVFTEVRNCCIALSERLDGHTYFFGDKPTELDAVVGSHICAITRAEGPTMHEGLTAIIRQFPQLTEHAFNICICYHECRTSRIYDEDFEIINTSSHDSLWSCSQPPESLPPLSDDFLFL